MPLVYADQKRPPNAWLEVLENRCLPASVPLAPTGFTATSNSATSVALTWTDASNDESAFEIYRKGPGAATFTPLATVAANTTKFTDSAVSANAAYFYQVRARNSTGASAFSYQSRVWTAVVPERIIDDNDTPRVTITGTWAIDTTSARYGPTALLDNNTGKGQKSVAYNSSLPTGKYEVYVRWTGGSNRATNTPVSLTNGSTVKNFTVNQTTGGNAWKLLGTYALSGSNLTVVKFSNAGTNGVVSADAVRFVNVTAPDVQWTSVMPSPVAKDEAQVANLDGKMFVFGGFLPTGPTAVSYVYDPQTNLWSQLPDMPTRLSHSGTAVVGREVYFAGGYIGTGSGFNQVFGVNNVWTYNVDTKKYAAFTPLPQPRGGGALVYLNGQLHFFGGVSPNDRADRGDHWLYDFAKPALGWQTAVALPHPRSHLAYVSFQGKVWAIGGQISTDADLTTLPFVNYWDPKDPSKWTEVASLTPARSHASSSTFVMGNRIIVIGGETYHGGHINVVTSYDPISNSWSVLDPILANRSSGVGVLLGTDLYFSGGVGSKSTYRGVFLS